MFNLGISSSAKGYSMNPEAVLAVPPNIREDAPALEDYRTSGTIRYYAYALNVQELAYYNTQRKGYH